MKPSRLHSAAVSLALIATGLLFLSAPAFADVTFGPAGSAAGQTFQPTALAVDASSGDLYVADTFNNRVDVFAADGAFLRAFGWGVADGAGQLETCTTATGCQAGLPGGGAGEFSKPSSIAVDNDPASPAYHDVFVVDSNNYRIERFHPDGGFVLAFGDGVDQTSGGDVCPRPGFPADVCKAGVKGFAAGQLNNGVQLAAALGGVVYVADNSNSNPFDRRVQAFDSSGALTGQPLTLSAQSGSILFLATDSAGDFYLDGSGVGVKKYDSGGACLAFCASPVNPSSNIRGLAVDRASGQIFVSDVANVSGSNASEVHLYSPAGTLTSVLYGDSLRRYTALAARSGGPADLYAIDQTNNDLVGLSATLPPGPLALPGATTNPLGNTSATLNGYVNPEGNAGTTAHFQYITQADYQANGNSFSGPHPATETADVAIGSDFSPHAVSVQIGCTPVQDPPQASCLQPSTAYRFRILATDGAHTNPGPVSTFTTKDPFDFGAVYSTAVGTDAAALGAELNPRGISATGYFDYVDDATYQADVSALGAGHGFDHATRAPDVPNQPPLAFGNAADQLVAQSAQVAGLSPDTTYHYRLRATDLFTSLPGPEATFHTFAPLTPNTNCPDNQDLRASTPSAALPDCRAYEMVSPPAKGGQDVGGLGTVTEHPFLFRPPLAQIRQATADGAKLTYSSPRPFADPAASPWESQYLASRTDSGWANRDITPPDSSASLYIHGGAVPTDDLHFQAFSADLCSGFLIQPTDTPLAPGDNPGYGDLYHRDLCADPFADTLLTTVAPTNQPPSDGDSEYHLRVQGLSTDASLAIFRADGKLATSGVQASSALCDATCPTRNGAPIYQLYLHGAGAALRLISVMPDGTASGLDSSLGDFRGSNSSPYSDNLASALSTDGTRAYWTSPMRSSTTTPKLYLRINADRAQSAIASGHCTDPVNRACTLPVSETVDPGNAIFWAATNDGSKALFSFDSGPSGGQAPHQGELYLYDLAKALAGDPNPATLIASGLQGVLGASADLSKVYLTSTSVLTTDPGPEGDTATAGRANLYLYTQGGGFRYIADLTSAISSAYGQNPYEHLARVSPDGTHAAFLALPSLTGADNADAASGAQDAQVYLYDAASGAGALWCASCNPAGARPSGRNFTGGITAPGVDIASYIPPAEYALHAPRNLADDGSRLFFDSFDALLPTDTNGKEDAYEWEAAATGDCHAGDPNYFTQNGGCLSLLSTGKDSDGSQFVDASADGADAFLTTRSRLYGADVDNLIDIYDARVNGGFPAPATTTACDLDAGGCEGAPSTAVQVPGAGSAAFSGDPNQPLHWSTPKAGRCAKGTRKVHSHGKTRCVRAHKHAPKHHKRHHNGRAHR